MIYPNSGGNPEPEVGGTPLRERWSNEARAASAAARRGSGRNGSQQGTLNLSGSTGGTHPGGSAAASHPAEVVAQQTAKPARAWGKDTSGSREKSRIAAATAVWKDASAAHNKAYVDARAKHGKDWQATYTDTASTRKTLKQAERALGDAGRTKGTTSRSKNSAGMYGSGIKKIPSSTFPKALQPAVQKFNKAVAARNAIKFRLNNLINKGGPAKAKQARNLAGKLNKIDRALATQRKAFSKKVDRARVAR